VSIEKLQKQKMQAVIVIVTKLILRYQKKIGTNDKQQWEQTVEQRIFSGCSSFPLRNAKLKTGLIDVDLVRGMYYIIVYSESEDAC
jgi:hypothetical protein